MNGYFRPLRRKFGVLTLLLACVFMVGWVRSLTVIDVLTLRPDKYCSVFIVSNKSWMFLQIAKAEVRQAHRLRWPTSYRSERARHLKHFFKCYPGQPNVLIVDGKSPLPKLSVYACPYWSIIIPLTLLSAWLLLSKPRKKKSTELPRND